MSALASVATNPRPGGLRALCIQHVPYEKLGFIEAWLARKGHGLALWQPFENEPEPALDSFDLLVVLGGSMNIYEHDDHPWLVTEKHFLQRVLDAGIPCLGLCLGAQLLADRLGGAVAKSPHQEVGWWPVRLTDAGRAAPELGGWGGADAGRPFEVFHWHDDSFALPPGVEALVESDGCPHQAFVARAGQVLAFQFHPELTPVQLEDWLSDGAPPPTKDRYVQTAEQMRERPERFATVNAWLEATLDRWLARLGEGARSAGS